MTVHDLLRRGDYITILLLAEKSGGAIRSSEILESGILSYDGSVRHLSASRISRILSRLVDAGLMRKEGRRFILTSRFRDMYARIQIEDRMTDADLRMIGKDAGDSGEVIIIWGGPTESKRESTIIAKHLRDAAYMIRDEGLRAGLRRFQKTLDGIINNRRYSIKEKAFAIMQAQAILEPEFEQMGEIPIDRLGTDLQEFLRRLRSSDGCRIIEGLRLRNRVRSHMERIRDTGNPELDSDRMTEIIRKVSEPMETLRKRPAAVIMVPMYYDPKAGKP